MLEYMIQWVKYIRYIKHFFATAIQASCKHCEAQLSKKGTYCSPRVGVENCQYNTEYNPGSGLSPWVHLSSLRRNPGCRRHCLDLRQKIIVQPYCDSCDHVM